MMAGNPNWWSMINGMHPQSQYQVYGSNSPISSNPSQPDHHHHHPNQDFPVRSWSQLLLGGGGGGEEERYGASIFQQQKKLENWEDQVLNLNPYSNFTRVSNIVDVKQEATSAQPTLESQFYDHQFQHCKPNSNPWPNHQILPVSSPTSCITTLSNNTNGILNFSRTKSATPEEKNQRNNQDHSSECNSTGTGGASNKKARVQQSSAQPALKVRKEKLGDRITALHQLVSPFGKTDTASVLSEAIGYIRFLQGQIEALSSPYMRNASASGNHQHSIQERNCLFPEEPTQDSHGRSGEKDLRSRGLCLVPISCTQHVGSDSGADYWAPGALGSGF